MSELRIIGRTTRTPELKISQDKQSIYATFFLAINRKDRTDFPRIVVFGKQAESLCNYVQRGDLICVDGVIQTDSHEVNGKTYYTTDIRAKRIQFLNLKSWRNNKQEEIPESIEADETHEFESIPQDEEVPF